MSNLNSENPPDSQFGKLFPMSHRPLLHRLRRVFCWRGETTPCAWSLFCKMMLQVYVWSVNWIFMTFSALAWFDQIINNLAAFSCRWIRLICSPSRVSKSAGRLFLKGGCELSSRAFLSPAPLCTQGHVCSSCSTVRSKHAGKHEVSTSRRRILPSFNVSSPAAF